jgi:hypothetical protein
VKSDPNEDKIEIAGVLKCRKPPFELGRGCTEISSLLDSQGLMLVETKVF